MYCNVDYVDLGDMHFSIHPFLRPPAKQIYIHKIKIYKYKTYFPAQRYQNKNKYIT